VNYVNPLTLGEPGKAVHPEVAYELTWNLIVFTVAMLTYDRFKRRVPVGVVGLTWLSVYAIGRFFLSFLRTDSLVFGLRQAQWAGLAMVVVSIVLVAIWTTQARRRKPQDPDEPDVRPDEESTKAESATA
jgi:phosphatidylglycerol:prolipoprotein diacylglycerol transferase